MTEETSNEVVEAPEVSESAEKPVSKFASLYASEQADKAESVEETLNVSPSKEPGKGFSWEDASWAEKTAKLEELGVDYGEWTDHLAGANETESEREWREMKEWKENEETRLEEEKRSFQESRAKHQETEYVKSLTDIVSAGAEKYELVAAHPQKEELLLHHARSYANKFGEVPNSEELVAFAEEQIFEEAKYFLKSKRIRDLILSQDSENSGARRSEEVERPTLSNQHERQESKVEDMSRGFETRDERIARITNKNYE